MQTINTFRNLVREVSYKPGWLFFVKQDERGVYLQIQVTEESEAAIDPFSKEITPWNGAKHYLSPHMCDSEVIGCAFDAIRRAEEHETREWFRFKDRSIFNPHTSIHVLYEIAGKFKNLDLRNDAMKMGE